MDLGQIRQGNYRMIRSSKLQSRFSDFKIYLKPVCLRMFFLGFSAGLPLLLVLGTLGFWLREAGIDLKTIGFLSWVGLVYGCKWLGLLSSTMSNCLVIRAFGPAAGLACPLSGDADYFALRHGLFESSDAYAADRCLCAAHSILLGNPRYFSGRLPHRKRFC